MSESLHDMLNRYYGGRGAAHLKVESMLRHTDPRALEEAKASHPSSDDPAIPLMNRTLSGWQGSSAKSYEGSLDHMDRVEARADATQLRIPRADGLADDFAALYGSEPVPLLATRLMTQHTWPDWKIAGVLLYLSSQKDPTALPAMLRFQRETLRPQHADLVAKALASFEPGLVKQAQRAEEGYQRKLTQVPASPARGTDADVEDEQDDDE